MKKIIEQVRYLCRDNKQVQPLLDELERWADAQVPLEHLDEMSKELNEIIHQYAMGIKFHKALKEVIDIYGQDIGLPNDMPVDQDGFETLKKRIQIIEDRKIAVDKLRTLYHIEELMENIK